MKYKKRDEVEPFCSSTHKDQKLLRKEELKQLCSLEDFTLLMNYNFVGC
jgi:hypothetical protein